MSEEVRIHMNNVDPTQITVNNLSYTLPNQTILNHIDAVFQPGKLSVIVGPSGSGKTTLLSLIAGLRGNMPSNAKQSGTILMNGTDVDTEKIRKIVGFVFQDDVILETMTVQEAINMSIKLRVGGMNETQKNALLKRMLDVSQLNKAQNTKIGSPMKKGISGGERKRTAIAMELVSNPSVLLLDEPTSGLDTYTAYRIMALLKRLAKRYGRTVVVTLHQPSSEIFHMIDDLYVLNDGDLVYGGPASYMVEYFSNLGYIFDQYSNPLDVLFMDILNKSSEDEFAEDVGKTPARQNEYVPLDQLATTYKNSKAFHTFVQSQIQNGLTTGVNKSMHRFRAKHFISFWFLMIRDTKNVLRNPLIVKTKLFQTLFLAAFIAIIFLNSGCRPVPARYQNIAGLLFFVIVNGFFASFQNVLPVFSSEKPSFSREHSQGYYGLSSYFLAKIAVELPLTLNFPFITALIVYFATGLRAELSRFLMFVLILQLLGLCGFAMGLFAACLFADVSVALAISILFILPILIVGGLYVNVDTIPVWLRWIQWISPIRYSYSAMMTNQFENWDSPGAQQYYQAIGASTGFSLFVNLLFLVLIFVVFLFAAYLALYRVVLKNEGRSFSQRFIKYRHDRKQKNNIQNLSSATSTSTPYNQEMQQIQPVEEAIHNPISRRQNL